MQLIYNEYNLAMKTAHLLVKHLVVEAKIVRGCFLFGHKFAILLFYPSHYGNNCNSVQKY